MKTWEEITLEEVKDFCKQATLPRLEQAWHNIANDIEEVKVQIDGCGYAIKAREFEGEDTTGDVEALNFYSELYMKMAAALKEVANRIYYLNEGHYELCENLREVEAWMQYPDYNAPDAEYWLQQADLLRRKRINEIMRSKIQ